MEKSKLFELFRTFSAWDLRNWRVFLSSPFTNRRADVLQLFDFIMEEMKKEKPIYSKEVAFKKMYPNEKYLEAKVVMAMSRLFRLGEKYLAFKRIEQNEDILKINAAREFRAMKMERNFNKAIKDASHAIEKKSYRNADYLQWRYVLEYEYYDYLETQKRGEVSNLQKTVKAFDHYTITNKLKLACLILSQRAIAKKEIDVGLLDEIIHFIKRKPQLLEEPALAIYYNIYNLIITQSDTYFFKLKELVPQYKSIFYPNEIRDIFLLMVNYCIRKSNQEDSKYHIESFELYKMGLEEGYLFEDELITQFTFNNIVTIALKLNKVKWAEDFINQNKGRVNKKDRAIIFKYNAARIHYQQKQYLEAMSILSNFTVDDLLLNIRGKILLLQTLYELKDSHYELLLSTIHSTRMYLQRKKSMAYHKAFFDNFMRYFKRLVDVQLFDEAEKNKLYHQIKKEQQLFGKEWLLGKVEGVM